jgi:hypothetical protein
MKNPSRLELGSLVVVIPRPLETMRGWIIAGGVIFLLFVSSPGTSISDIIGAAAAVAILVMIIRLLGTTRVYEFGLESNGTRMHWDKLVAYRLSWAFVGPQRILLIEQATGRELPMFLGVFQSDKFRDAVGDRKNLDALVEVGLP